MPALSLADLVQALTNAVVEAQNGVENQQIAMLSRFFDDKGRPICMPIMTPKMGFAEQDTDYNILNVPLISLVEATMLHITEFEVSFDVELSGLGEQDGDGLDHAPAAPAPAPGGLDHAPPAPPWDGPPPPAPDPSEPVQTTPAQTTPAQTGPAQTAPVQRAQALRPDARPAAALATSDAGSVETSTAGLEGEVFGAGSPFRRFLRGFGVRTTVPPIGLDAIEAGPAAAEGDGAQVAAPSAPPSAQRALVAEPARAEEASSAPPEPPVPAMIVGLGPKGATAPTAKATLKVSSRAMSDGMVRLLNHLNKTF